MRILIFLTVLFSVIGCSSTPDSPENQTKDAFPEMTCYCPRSCLSLIQTKIHWYWVKPEMSEKTKLKAAMFIEIDESGTIQKTIVTQTSGNSDYDQSALKAVNRAAPFREISGLTAKEKKLIRKIEVVF